MTLVNPGTPSERRVHSKASDTVEYGDVVSFQQSGAGGYGPPWERDPRAVLRDVVEDYVSLDGARQDYGVVVDPATMTVDEARDGGRPGRHASARAGPPVVTRLGPCGASAVAAAGAPWFNGRRHVCRTEVTMLRSRSFDARPGVTAGLALALAVATAALAHHGWSGYDASKPLTVTGTIKVSGYEHPHGYVRLDDAGEGVGGDAGAAVPDGEPGAAGGDAQERASRPP